MTIGEKIYTLRTRAGFSQEGFAEVIGVSRQSVSKWETSVAVPDTEYIVKICKTLHVSADMLIMDEEISDTVTQALPAENPPETSQQEDTQQPLSEAEQPVVQSYLAGARCKRNKILAIVGFVLSFIIGTVGIILCSIVVHNERALARYNHVSIWGLAIGCVKFYLTVVLLVFFMLY